MALYELRTYTLYVGKMAEAGFPGSTRIILMKRSA